MSFAQTRVVGEVSAKSDTQITIKTDNGEAVEVPITAETKFVRVPPGETSLASASPISLNDVSAGDRVLVRPNQIVIMSRSDLQQKHAADQVGWQKRGTAGKITSIRSNSINIITAGGQQLNVVTGPETEFRRYAPDSVRFSDAKPSAFADLKVGDQVRVLGNRDGDTVAGEMLVSGQFRNFAATVISTDPSAGVLKLTDLATKKPVTVKITPDSKSRTIPPMIAQRLASRNTAVPEETGPAQRSRAADSPGRGQRSMDIGQMLDRMPPLELSQLKPGDAVLVASTAGVDPSNVTAIAIVSGVEPLLTGPPADRRLSGTWNFDVNLEP